MTMMPRTLKLASLALLATVTCARMQFHLLRAILLRFGLVQSTMAPFVVTCGCSLGVRPKSAKDRNNSLVGLANDSLLCGTQAR